MILRKSRVVTATILCLVAGLNFCEAFVGGALNKVSKDLAALTRRVTAYHILVANEEVALALKRKIRDSCVEKERFVIDVFQEAAEKYSQDDTTNFRGGLLGELVPQGYCRSKILDRACFQSQLGQLEGPIKSEFGHHLLLVTERTNCPKLDGKNTKLMQLRGDDVFGTLVPSKQVGSPDVASFALQQLGYWVFVFFAGGILAEVLARLVDGI
jgi:peptidyl-prolyl cis-trans isomerase C